MKLAGSEATLGKSSIREGSSWIMVVEEVGDKDKEAEGLKRVRSRIRMMVLSPPVELEMFGLSSRQPGVPSSITSVW